MHRFSLLLVAMLLSRGAWAQPGKERLAHLMDGFAKDGFNGTVLVAKKGAVLLAKGYGYRNFDSKEPNDANTIFRIAEVTEPVTAEMILSLDSKAQLGLDDKVAKYLPEFSGGERVSIRNLLTHTSGVQTYVPDTTIQKNKVCRPMNLQTFLETYRNKPLLFLPGSRYQYSNADYILLGFIIGKIANTSYEIEVRHKITSICAMHRTGFDFSDLKDENKATGYLSAGNKLTPVHTTGDTAILYPANAMYSTVADLLKWHEALRYYRMLPKDWQELAYTPNKNQFALGWTIERLYNRRIMQQEGSFSGFTASIIRQEEDDVFIAVLENRMHPGYHNMPVAKALLKALYTTDHTRANEKTEKNTAGDPPADGSLKRYTGKYQFNADYSMTFSVRGDNLTVESPDEQPIILEAQGDNTFKTRGADVTIEFIPDTKGLITKAILRQNGKEYTGKKIK